MVLFRTLEADYLRLAGKLTATVGLIGATLAWLLPADFAGILIIALLLPGILLPAVLSWCFGEVKLKQGEMLFISIYRTSTSNNGVNISRTAFQPVLVYDFLL